MKKIAILISFITSIGLTAFTLKPADEKFAVDTDKSTLTWFCKKVGGQHNGAVKLNEGSLIFDGNNLKGGTFIVNMPSMTIDDGGANVLDDLKSDNFFSVNKFPTSTFTITKVSSSGTDQVNITGNLTIKGITNPITFPATVKKQDNTVVAVAKGIKVDRTKYDIKYRSIAFFSTIGNRAIDDEFEISVSLVAKK
jgi:polyisoprenoid-binding protein YceI